MKIARGEESHGGVPGGTSLYVGILGMGYVNAPYEMLGEKLTPSARLSGSRYLPPREIQPQKTGTTE